MNTRPRFRLTAAVAAVALLAGACGGPELSGPSGSGSGEAQLRVTAFVVGTPIDLMVAHVTAADIATPLVFNLPVVDGVATGTLRIPPGEARTITLEAFDELGNVTHEGSATIDVHSGPNLPVNIAMLPKSGDIPVTATLAEFSVIITPSSATVAAGLTTQFTAQILDVDNNPLAGTVTWAVTNPAFARIDQGGLASGVAPGELTIVATFGGVAGLAHLVVLDGTTGFVHGTVSSAFQGPLPFVGVTAGGAIELTDGEGLYLLTVPEGPATVSLVGLPEWCDDPGFQQVEVVAGQAVQLDFGVTCTLGVIVTEVMAWPVGTSAGQFGEAGQWIELYNGSSAPVDISGWLLVYDFSSPEVALCQVQAGVIPAGAHVVVGQQTDPALNGGIQNVIACTPTGEMPNFTETIVAVSGPGAEWDVVLADTPIQGVSASLSSAAYHPVSNDNPAAWCPGTSSYGTAGNLGTPGQPNPACGSVAGSILITEVMRDPEGDGDWVELFNSGGAPVDVSGWTITRVVSPEVCVLGTGSVPAGAHRVVARVVDPALNGGISGAIQCSGALLDSSGFQLLELADTQEALVDEVATPSSTPFPGRSFSLSQSAYSSGANDDPDNWCPGVTPYGTEGKLGTPGQLNPPCP